MRPTSCLRFIYRFARLRGTSEIPLMNFLHVSSAFRVHIRHTFPHRLIQIQTPSLALRSFFLLFLLFALGLVPLDFSSCALHTRDAFSSIRWFRIYAWKISSMLALLCFDFPFVLPLRSLINWWNIFVLMKFIFNKWTEVLQLTAMRCDQLKTIWCASHESEKHLSFWLKQY